MTTTYSNPPPIPKLPGYVVSMPHSLGDKRLPRGQTLVRAASLPVVQPLSALPMDGSAAALLLPSAR